MQTGQIIENQDAVSRDKGHEGIEIGTTVAPAQLIQEVFRELTGKSVKTIKIYRDPIELEFDDLEQFNFKIVHACSQYNVKSTNFQSTIFYSDDTHDSFASFDQMNPQESPHFSYNN